MLQQEVLILLVQTAAQVQRPDHGEVLRVLLQVFQHEGQNDSQYFRRHLLPSSSGCEVKARSLQALRKSQAKFQESVWII